MTVGKLYGGILIYDCWKKTKFGQIEVLRQQEAEIMELEKAAKEADRARRRQEAIDRGEDPDAIIFTSEDEDEEGEEGEEGDENAEWEEVSKQDLKYNVLKSALIDR